MRWNIVLASIIAVTSSPVVPAEIDGCAITGGTSLEQTQCISKRIHALDAELNRTYQLALSATPEHDPQDSRKEREQLRRAQRAWLKYKNDNCSLVGGLEGGNNLSVTRFIALCEENEIKGRIQFLKGIANGSFKL